MVNSAVPEGDRWLSIRELLQVQRHTIVAGSLDKLADELSMFFMFSIKR